MPESLESRLQRAITSKAFAFVHAEAMHALLLHAGMLDDWVTFAGSWNDLPLDEYMADHGRYRRRRHAIYVFDSTDSITRQTHQPHYQSRDYNSLNGGIARWFEPIAAPIADGETLRAILKFCHSLFGKLAPDVHRWRVEVHQFRIEANADSSGLPTPEGVHRDGVDYVLVLLIARENIASGTTTIDGQDGKTLGNFTLTQPLDAALLDDRRVSHGVTAVQALDAREAAYRDVLVVTLRRVDG